MRASERVAWASEATDEELLIEIQECTDPATTASAELCRRFYQRFYGFFKSQGLQDADAQDLAQEAVLRLLLNIVKWDRNRPIAPFAWKIAHNLLIDFWRRTARKRDREKHISSRAAGDDAPDGLDTVALSGPVVGVGEIAMRQAIEDIHECLGRLTNSHREAIVFWMLDALTYEEVGQVVGCSDTAVATRVFHAKQKLTACMRSKGYCCVPAELELSPGSDSVMEAHLRLQDERTRVVIEYDGIELVHFDVDHLEHHGYRLVEVDSELPDGAKRVLICDDCLLIRTAGDPVEE